MKGDIEGRSNGRLSKIRKKDERIYEQLKHSGVLKHQREMYQDAKGNPNAVNN
jgi:hypothetical protein